jgi:hypothetical protein
MVMGGGSRDAEVRHVHGMPAERRRVVPYLELRPLGYNGGNGSGDGSAIKEVSS